MRRLQECESLIVKLEDEIRHNKALLGEKENKIANLKEDCENFKQNYIESAEKYDHLDEEHILLSDK